MTHKMLPEHKAKVDIAIKECEGAYDYLFKLFSKYYKKPISMDLKYLLLQHSFVAGGVFRSIFTDNKINDIDIFFDSQEASLEFRHLVHLNWTKNVFHSSTVSSNKTYNLVRKQNPNISLITYRHGPPLKVIGDFDFSFNQHFFRMNDYTMMFNVDTFSKVGKIITKEEPKVLFERTMRFMKEGFKLDRDSEKGLFMLLSKTKDEDGEPLYSLSHGGSGGSSEETLVGLSNEFYTEGSYFGANANPAPFTDNGYRTLTDGPVAFGGSYGSGITASGGAGGIGSVGEGSTIAVTQAAMEDNLYANNPSTRPRQMARTRTTAEEDERREALVQQAEDEYLSRTPLDDNF